MENDWSRCLSWVALKFIWKWKPGRHECWEAGVSIFYPGTFEMSAMKTYIRDAVFSIGISDIWAFVNLQYDQNNNPRLPSTIYN